MILAKWTWAIYESNQVDVKLYQYLKSCARTKDTIVKAIEAFYLPVALKHANASPLEIHKAYQQSIDTLLSMVRLLSIEAKASLDIDIEIDRQARSMPTQHQELEIVGTASVQENRGRLDRLTQEARSISTERQELEVKDEDDRPIETIWGAINLDN